MPFFMFFFLLPVYPNLIAPFFGFFFWRGYLHSSHIVAQISARIPSADGPRIPLSSLEGREYILFYAGDEADEHSVIKMFPARPAEM